MVAHVYEMNSTHAKQYKCPTKHLSNLFALFLFLDRRRQSEADRMKIPVD